MTDKTVTTTVKPEVLNDWMAELDDIERHTSGEHQIKRTRELLEKIYILGTEDGERFAYAKRNIRI